MKKRRFVGRCPICNRAYGRGNQHTRHHLFPKVWYRDGIKLDVCHLCHQVEFNNIYKMNHYWTRKECFNNWVNFCKSKGKNALEIYPELLQLYT